MTARAVPPALLVLRCVRGLGIIGLRRLIEQAGSADAAVAVLSPTERNQASGRAREVMLRCEDRGLSVVSAGDAVFPEHLHALEDPPPVLFTAGNAAWLQAPSVAIVGSREPSAYGERVTRRLARALSAQGVTVVSGLARGIDAMAHEAALLGAGSTVAVLGTGADTCYPRQNRWLYDRILTQGVVASEMLPGTVAHPGSFPRRNRIIAGLADVTVVVEAGATSGALITAQHATAIGRTVGAVPGAVDVASSQGSNALLRDGAHVVTGPEDVLALLDLTARGRARQRMGAPAASPAVPPDLSDQERRVLDLVSIGARLPDELVAAARLPAPQLATAIASLEMRGLVVLGPSGLVHRSD